MDFCKKMAVKPGRKVKLKEIDPDDKLGFDTPAELQQRLEKNLDKLSKLQYRLYAENKRSLLVVLQAMDAGGKDGTINKVFSAMNPQGCRVVSFKAPSSLELTHDFLWRVHQAAPRHGELVVFNRSHYEDVLIVRVHDLVPKSIWSQRYEMINRFEELLASNNTTVIKIFLHISEEEQLKRFIARFSEPEKQWKISEADYQERKYWNDYQQAFEEVFERCSTPNAPWYIVPADNKLFRNVAVSEILRETLEGLDLQLPEPGVNLKEIRKEMESALTEKLKRNKK